MYAAIWMSSDSPIPRQAEEVLERVDQAGNKVFRCVVDGQVVGKRIRDTSGALAWEFQVKDGGEKHGLERQWAPDGTLEFETTYVDGREHGVARQWDHGKLLGTYQMEHGTGVDLWRDSSGALLEERYVKDGYRDGFERWWRGDNATVSDEGHFKHGQEHGIFRRWNARGRLCRGYPRYVVDGVRVTKRRYLRACAADPSLPLFREDENRPERPLPAM